MAAERADEVCLADDKAVKVILPTIRVTADLLLAIFVILPPRKPLDGAPGRRVPLRRALEVESMIRAVNAKIDTYGLKESSLLSIWPIFDLFDVVLVAAREAYPYASETTARLIYNIGCLCC